MTVGKSFANYEEQFNQNTGSKLNEPTINTILTMVIRVKQPMTVKMLSGREFDIVWNYQYSEPELIEPGTTAVDVRGILAVSKWLEKQTAIIDFYANTKQNLYRQPNDRA